jgi:S-(hydroxymethyl)glutathione dehydrogenase/alcohol dehydrogenase
MQFQAAVLRAFDAPLSIETLNIRNLRETDVLVRIAATSLCHADLEAVTGRLGGPLPIVPGHEAAGVVEWTGSAVRRCKPGDHAIASYGGAVPERDFPLLVDAYKRRARPARSRP